MEREWCSRMTELSPMAEVACPPSAQYQPSVDPSGKRKAWSASSVSWRARTTRGDQGHLMLRERVSPRSEVIRAVLLGDARTLSQPISAGQRWNKQASRLQRQTT